MTDSSSPTLSIHDLMLRQRQWSEERDWAKFHTPRNLVLALVGEVGELSEIFQWKGEVSKGLPEFAEAEKIHVGEELSDCLLYLVRLSDVCGINLSEAVLSKMEKNSLKYKVSACKGSASKYTEYKESDE
jgi:dCTP diphosphatase